MSEPAKPVIEVRDLSYAYDDCQALHTVNFSVPPQSIHGFVGPNGAGKTTTLRILAGLLEPQFGVARVLGWAVSTRGDRVRREVGYMPDNFGMYGQMTVFEYLDFFSAAYGLKLAQRTHLIEDVLALTDMVRCQDTVIKELSRGMRQRVGLARALVNDPELLLLDEPASGLDPRARVELMAILLELRDMGKTVFISSHILGELGEICDSLTILDNGRTTFSGSMAELLALEDTVAVYSLALAEDGADLHEVLRSVDGIASVERLPQKPCYRLTFDRNRTDTGAIIAAVLEAGSRIVSFQPDLPELSKAFMRFTSPGVAT